MENLEAAKRRLNQRLYHLTHLRFVKSIHIQHNEPTSVRVDTAAGSFNFQVRLIRSYLDRTLANDLIQIVKGLKGRGQSDLLLVARYVPRPTGERLAEAGVNFLDDAGNINLALGGNYHSLVLGKPEIRSAEKRSPGPATIQVLLTLTAQPETWDWPVRQLASAAGVSKTVAAEVRQRLVEEGALRQGKDGQWQLLNPQDIREQCLSGYTQLLRPRLLINRFRSLEKDADKFVAEFIRIVSESGKNYALTGGAGAFALQHFYRGPETAIFVEETSPNIERRAKLLPDPKGAIVLLRAFATPLVFWKLVRGVWVAHPLLIHLELLQQDDPRAHEAAERIREEFLKP
jgi:hypothetical protein